MLRSLRLLAKTFGVAFCKEQIGSCRFAFPRLLFALRPPRFAPFEASLIGASSFPGAWGLELGASRSVVAGVADPGSQQSVVRGQLSGPGYAATVFLMRKQYSAPPPMTIDVNKKYSATFNTSRGEIVCELFAKEAPKTVNNFVFLARDKFYDGLVFHRVIPNFMVQGGDPTGTGRGGPGYKFEDEVKSNSHKHQVGSLSMANAGPNTNGSQFFITHVATNWLDGKHTVFGKVLSGQDVVNAIKGGDELTSVMITES